MPWSSAEKIQKFYLDCVAYWKRLGDDDEVARCKAVWWDIVEIANTFSRWNPFLEKFVLDLVGYKPGDPVPDEIAIRSGNCPPTGVYRDGRASVRAPRERLYIISFRKEECNMIDQIVFHCWAESVQDAKKKASATWENRNKIHGHVPHMFHLEAHRATSQNVEDLRVVNWIGSEITGADVMHTFITTRSVARGGAWL